MGMTDTEAGWAMVRREMPPESAFAIITERAPQKQPYLTATRLVQTQQAQTERAQIERAQTLD